MELKISKAKGVISFINLIIISQTPTPLILKHTMVINQTTKVPDFKELIFEVERLVRNNNKKAKQNNFKMNIQIENMGKDHKQAIHKYIY